MFITDAIRKAKTIKPEARSPSKFKGGRYDDIKNLLEDGKSDMTEDFNGKCIQSINQTIGYDSPKRGRKSDISEISKITMEQKSFDF